MNTPLLSVIVPVYNTEQYVNRCLDSILNQTYHNIEIIIVDDASEGDIKNIAVEYCKRYNNVRLISHEKNMGLFQARITGLKEAKGDYFAFVDSDDYISVDYYRIMLNKAVAEQADIVVSDHLESYENEKSLYFPHGMIQQIDWNLKNEEIINMLMQQHGLDYSWWVVWNKIYSIHLWWETRELLEPLSTHFIMCEDVAFSVAFFSYAKHLVNTHHNYYYRSNEASTISTTIDYEKYIKSINDFTKAFGIAKKVLLKNDLWKKNEQYWEMWYASIADIWRNRVSFDSKLKNVQRLHLQNMFKDLPTAAGTDTFDLSRDFCSHGVKGCAEDWVNEIKKGIASEECKVVSFDIFDTLFGQVQSLKMIWEWEIIKAW